MYSASELCRKSVKFSHEGHVLRDGVVPVLCQGAALPLADAKREG
jgi:hypothetical protein